MLIILCIFFPPAIPIVAIYYLWGGAKRQRKQIRLAQTQNALTEELLIATAPPHYLMMRNAQIMRQRRFKRFALIGIAILIACLAAMV